MMSGTAAPKFTDVSIGGALGLSHHVTTAANDFVNYEAGYGPLGPRDKFFGRLLKSVRYKPSSNTNLWVWVMRAVSFDGGHDFTINPGCTMDGAGNVTQFNTFVSYDGDPRHLLEYTPDGGLVWTRPDGTRVVYDFPFGILNKKTCFTPDFGNGSELSGYGITRVEYPNGFTITGGGPDLIGEVKTNTGFQLTYIYVARPNVDPYYGATHAQAPWAPTTADAGWGSVVPAYIVALNNVYDYCAPRIAGNYASVADACPGLTREWPHATYQWPIGMPRAAYIKDQETVFTIKDAGGGVTKYIHKPFRATASGVSTDIYHPRLYKIQPAGSDVPAITYTYETKNIGIEGGTEFTGTYPIWVSGPAAQLKESARSTTAGQPSSDKLGYSVGEPYGRGGMSFTGNGNGEGAINIYTHNEYGPFKIEMWDKVIEFDSQKSNKLTSVRRLTDGVTVTYEYDTRFNVTKILENGVEKSSALYPTTCAVAERKVCNQPTWTKDGKGNRTDYYYDANSGQVSRVVMPADANGVRPEIRYEYAPKYAYYKRSAGGLIQQADTPVYLLTRETKCLTGAMLESGQCAKGLSDTVTTTYDYGPTGVGNNLLLRGVAVTAYADGVSQTRRTCHSFDIYGNRIGETKPNAGLASCN